MARRSTLLDDSVVDFAKSELKKLGEYGYVSKKLQAVIAAGKHGVTEVAKIYDISRTTLTEWIKHVKQQNMDKLKAPATRKRKHLLSEAQLQHIEAWMEQHPNITIRELRVLIEEKMGIVAGQATVHRAMRKLRFSYQTPRPKHYKQDPTQVEAFKKKSTAASQATP